MKDLPNNVTAIPTDSQEASEAIAHQWMADSARTASAHDFDSHMDLISKKVTVRGVPDVELVNYDAWAKQCHKEFTSKLIEQVSYRGFKFIVASDERIMFKTVETIKTSEGKSNENGLEVVLEKEDDGKWRVRQERILPPEEVAHDKLLEGV